MSTHWRGFGDSGKLRRITIEAPPVFGSFLRWRTEHSYTGCFPPPRNIRHRRLGQERGIIALPAPEQSSKFRIAAVATLRTLRCRRG